MIFPPRVTGSCKDGMDEDGTEFNSNNLRERDNAPTSIETRESEPVLLLGAHGNQWNRQDRFLPVANIARIMKRVLPPNEKIAKDAKEAVQECVSEFICFVTSEASDRCQTEKRKTINGDDLVWAMGTLGFDDYVNPLKTYLTKYRQAAKADKSERVGRGRAGDLEGNDAGEHQDGARYQTPAGEMPQDEDHILERQLADFIHNDDRIL
mmetsp:Transcript_26742/g.87492  ORF Transcript_26742/g.87492 Transcript_26742/m.87492 type:complete len:209 (-) Transcript_26742:368-994(-)